LVKACVIEGRMHANVQATHHSTIEITCEDHLTPRGDCIVVTSAKIDLNCLRELCDRVKVEVCFYTEVGNFCLEGMCIKPGDPCSLVIRKSSAEDTRTVVIKSSAAAVDINRNIIKKGRLLGVNVRVVFRSKPEDRAV